MGPSEAREKTETKLKRIAELSKQDPNRRFECLMHHFNYESLVERFQQLDKNKAVGIDGINKATYGENLEVNIQDLIARMKKMAYRPGPVREVLIPKEGKPGATRPLGISNLEDKIVQGMVQKILESIYEPLFLECSYGFRSGRGCHDAIRALNQHLYKNDVQTIIDIDLKNFFGTIGHKMLEDILAEKIKDKRFMRYINRMFKAGVLAAEELRMSDEGVPQGSICSPVLANIFAHYAIDLWIEEMVRPVCKGKVALIRYADDAVICCQYESDAQRIRAALPKRLAKFKLALNEEKTKVVPFDKRQVGRGVKQGTFDFLGFTFYWGKSRAGLVVPKLKTRGKTKKAKLNKVTAWIKELKSRNSLNGIWKTFRTKLNGHIQYYGVSYNVEEVHSFLRGATKIMFKWLNRRSQRKSYSWEQFLKYIDRHPLPRARVVHPMFQLSKGR
jgi:group II intron reverse transcriptase/maturase